MDTKFLIELLQAMVALISLILSNTAIVESFKRVINIIIKQFPILSNFTIKGTGTFILAALVAYGVGAWAHVDLAGLLGLSKYLNPELISLATWATTLIFSGKVYDWFIKEKALITQIGLSSSIAGTSSDGTTTTVKTVTQKTE